MQHIWCGYPGSGYYGDEILEPDIRIKANSLKFFPGLFLEFGGGSPGLALVAVDLETEKVVQFRIGGYELPSRKVPMPR